MFGKDCDLHVTHSYPLIAHYDEVYLLPGVQFKMPIMKSPHKKKS